MSANDAHIASLVEAFRRGDYDALRSPEARHALRTEATSAPNAALREAAVSTLSSLGDSRDLALLMDLFGDPDVQDVAQASVEEDFGSAAVPAILERLSTCKDDCLHLIETVEHLGDASTFASLTPLLERDDQNVAEWAARAITTIGRRTNTRTEAADALRRGLVATQNEFVREHIERLLETFG